MSRSRLIFHGRLNTPTPTPSGAVTYDTRFGTATDATGWFTFGLHSGNRRVWLDSLNGNDVNDGLSAATAKKTPAAAIHLFLVVGWTSGDQLMVAGGEAQTYLDPNDGVNWRNQPGISAAYPTAALCYDSTDPSNAAKYGKLLGSKKPRWLVTSAGTGSPPNLFFSMPGDVVAGHGRFALQGIDLDGQAGDNLGLSFVGEHSNLAFQNVRFMNGMGIVGAFDATSFGRSTAVNVSKCSFHSPWLSDSGNNSGIYVAGLDNLWVQDCVFVHCGWKQGASRDDPTALGGATVLGHSVYYHAGQTGAHWDRITYVDSESDGWGLRGDATATQLFSMDEPIVGAVTGFSVSYMEQPAGAIVTVDDFVACGGIGLNSSRTDGGGAAAANAKAGTYLNNGVLFDNPVFGHAYASNVVFGMGTYSAADVGAGQPQITQSVVLSNIRCHNYADYAEYVHGNGSGSLTWSNCILDTLNKYPSGTIAGTGNSLASGASYPNASFNRSALITAMGFSTKAAMVNAMLAFPHLQWAQAAIGLSFSAFGATATYATASVPSISGLPTPEVVYPTTLSNLTLTSSTFTRGVAKTVQLLGTSANFVLTSADLPSGFTITGTQLIYNGSGSGAATPTIHVLETNADGAGTHTTALTLTIS